MHCSHSPVELPPGHGLGWCADLRYIMDTQSSVPQVLHGNSGSSQHKSVTLLWSHHQCDIIIIRKKGKGKRRFESFQVKRALTERLRRSAIPYMQRLLNEHERKKKDICRQISNFNPVNNGLICKSVSLRH